MTEITWNSRKVVKLEVHAEMETYVFLRAFLDTGETVETGYLKEVN